MFHTSHHPARSFICCAVLLLLGACSRHAVMLNSKPQVLSVPPSATQSASEADQPGIHANAAGPDTMEADAPSCTPVAADGVKAVHAAPPASQQPDDPQKQKARALLDAGIAAYDAGDYARALPLFEQADAAGHLKAQRYIGLMYLNGQGVQASPDKAFNAFQAAADRGDITSQCWLGLMYENGTGTSQDMAQAVKWYETSAQRGDLIAAPAMTALGRLYESGKGVPRNTGTAIGWYRKAAATGEKDAIDALQRLDAGTGTRH